MSKIIKSRNLFLEKEELTRWDRFYQEDGVECFIKNMTASSGIVPDLSDNLSDNFLFTQGSSHLKIKLIQDSIAYNSLGNRIYFKNQVGYEWSVPFNAGSTKDTWVWMQYKTTHIEEGVVSLAINGALTGVGTKFTEIFRGQSTMVPNKIRIYSKTASVGASSGYTYGLQGTYEVNEVITDTTLFLNTFNALPAGNYVFSVVGAFSPGSYDDSREEEIYEYDFVDIQFSNTLPTLASNQYLLCKVAINDATSTQIITDLRVNKLILKSELTTTLEKVVEVGSWNMNTTPYKDFDLEVVLPGVTFDKIISIDVSIFNDIISNAKPLTLAGSAAWGALESGYDHHIFLNRNTGEFFDSVDYVSTSINRGIMFIKYLR